MGCDFSPSVPPVFFVKGIPIPLFVCALHGAPSSYDSAWGKHREVETCHHITNGSMYHSFVLYWWSFIICKSGSLQIRVLQAVLEELCSASGLKIKFAKSKAMASWCVDSALRNRLASITIIPFTDNIGKYRGFPIHQGCVRNEAFVFIVDRVTSRVASWKCNLLKKPARLTLAKSLFSAIPVYVM